MIGSGQPPGSRGEPDSSVAVRPLETKLVLAERPVEANKRGTGLRDRKHWGGWLAQKRHA